MRLTPEALVVASFDVGGFGELDAAGTQSPVCPTPQTGASSVRWRRTTARSRPRRLHPGADAARLPPRFPNPCPEPVP